MSCRSAHFITDRGSRPRGTPFSVHSGSDDSGRVSATLPQFRGVRMGVTWARIDWSDCAMTSRSAGAEGMGGMGATLTMGTDLTESTATYKQFMRQHVLRGEPSGTTACLAYVALGATKRVLPLDASPSERVRATESGTVFRMQPKSGNPLRSAHLATS